MMMGQSANHGESDAEAQRMVELPQDFLAQRVERPPAAAAGYTPPGSSAKAVWLQVNEGSAGGCAPLEDSADARPHCRPNPSSRRMR